MPYALFEGGEKLTRSFASEQDVWDAAEQAGLIELGPDGEKNLEDGYEIKPCEADPEDASQHEFRTTPS